MDRRARGTLSARDDTWERLHKADAVFLTRIHEAD